VKRRVSWRYAKAQIENVGPKKKKESHKVFGFNCTDQDEKWKVEACDNLPE
jgi:hypothetical protein